MGMTTVQVRLANVVDRNRETEVEMTVDSGAIYSVAPSSILRRIGVEAERMGTMIA